MELLKEQLRQLEQSEEYNKISTILVKELYFKKGSLYNGFWGKNGYYSFKIYFKYENKYYHISDKVVDIISFTNKTELNIMMDITKELKDYIRIYTLGEKYRFKLHTGISEFNIELIKGE
jgi:hypothetical protein